jgi:uracil-DNA glycosylase family 4
MNGREQTLSEVYEELIQCRRCPRLVAWREEVGRNKRRAFRHEDYWARPVPGFGDPKAHILIFGLAPGAHGSNRTGRMFTGDASGDFLYPALWRAGLASQPQASGRDDGLELFGVYITAAVRCAPPKNKPTRAEFAACSYWTERELALLPDLKVYLALGKLAHDALLDYHGLVKARYPFGHGREYRLPDGRTLLDSYHVSRQNTQTGRLTAEMFDQVLARARKLAGAG